MTPIYPDLWMIALAFAGGIALGGLNFAGLACNVGLYVAGRASVGKALTLHILRLGTVVGAFWTAAGLGPVILIITLGGFLAARMVATHLAREPG